MKDINFNKNQKTKLKNMIKFMRNYNFIKLAGILSLLIILMKKIKKLMPKIQINQNIYYKIYKMKIKNLNCFLIMLMSNF